MNKLLLLLGLAAISGNAQTTRCSDVGSNRLSYLLAEGFKKRSFDTEKLVLDGKVLIDFAPGMKTPVALATMVVTEKGAKFFRFDRADDGHPEVYMNVATVKADKDTVLYRGVVICQVSEDSVRVQKPVLVPPIPPAVE